MHDLKQHPLSAAFPAMSDDDFQSLVDSIDCIGVQNPITIYEGMVIDGWHRYKAASQLMMNCPSVTLDDKTDPRDFVLAQNKARRHISVAQLAYATTQVYQWRESGENQHKAGGAVPAPPQEESKTVAEMSEISGVSKRSIQQAKVVQTDAVDEVKQAVARGVIGLEKATEITKLPPEQQAAAIKKPLKEIKQQIEPVSEPVDEPEFVGADEDELNEQLADLEMYYKWLDEDDKLKAATNEIKQLNLVNRGLQSRVDGLLSENAVLKSTVKRQQRQIDKYKKEGAHV